jgi:hypothetical protein
MLFTRYLNAIQSLLDYPPFQKLFERGGGEASNRYGILMFFGKNNLCLKKQADYVKK